MSRIRITLEADDTDVKKFQESLGDDRQGGERPFDLMDAILWEMDYGESSTGGERSSHNGIKIKFEEIESEKFGGDTYEFESAMSNAIEGVVEKQADDGKYSSLGQWGDEGIPFQQILFRREGKSYYINFGRTEEPIDL